VTLYSFAMGAVIGVIYDIFRLWRVITGIGVTSRVAGWLYKRKLPLIRGKRGYIRPSVGNGAVSLAVFFIFDLLFSLTAAASYALFLHHACRGVIRWTYLLASILGFMLYNRTVSRITIGVLEVAVFFVRAFFRYVTQIVIVPMMPVIHLVKRILRATVVRDIINIRSVLSDMDRRRRTGPASSETVNPPNLPVVGRSGRCSKNRN